MKSRRTIEKMVLHKQTRCNSQTKDSDETETTQKAICLAEKMVEHYKIAGKTKCYGSYNH